MTAIGSGYGGLRAHPTAGGYEVIKAGYKINTSKGKGKYGNVRKMDSNKNNNSKGVIQMIRVGDMRVSYSARGIAKYEQEVWHDGLNKYQLITGNDPYVVEQKLNAKISLWDEMWKKKEAAEKKLKEKEDKAKDVEDKKQLVIERTEEAKEALQVLDKVLEHTLEVDDAINWESLKNYADYPAPKPDKPKPPDMPCPPVFPPEPKPTDAKYQVKLGFLDKVMSSRKETKEEEAAQSFKADYQAGQEAKQKEIEEANTRIKKYNETVICQAKNYKAEVKSWEEKRLRYIKKRDAGNFAVEKKKESYLGGDLSAVLDYCDMVLTNSQYPDYFPQTYEIDYNPENKILIVDYQLPSPNNLPTLCEVKYVQTRDKIDEKHISKAQQDKIYDSLIYQIVLRTLHELYEADKIDAIQSVVFNGFVHSVDPATGQETTGCVVSLQANKEEFVSINLEHVDPKACFKKMKGVGSSKLHSMTPVAPILDINRDDKRFVASYGVADSLDEGDNLAAMDWEDFEHLVRELFEKEFTTSGGEVKVTRASRDGGIDAVVFDPDPIRGGKIAIQAKRYTNTVGVSAVRDLYGTVVNEGAIKGILVSTSDYGPDAYEFAKGKPLTLLSGGNLLHLLQKHGYKAKIDLKEAKRMLLE